MCQTILYWIYHLLKVFVRSPQDAARCLGLTDSRENQSLVFKVALLVVIIQRMN